MGGFVMTSWILVEIIDRFFALREKCGHGADMKVLLYSNLNHIFVEHKMRMYGKSYICFGARGEQRGRIAS